MNGLQALTTLLQHAERERDEAQSKLLHTEHALVAANGQYLQLQDYRRDYQKRWSEQFGQQGTMEIVNCYHGFVGRLGMAIDQQEQIAVHARQQRDTALMKLRELETRVASIGKLIERRLAEARLQSDQRDQKATDEMASRLAWARIHGNANAAAEAHV
jgi:flagellar FliJ protein